MLAFKFSVIAQLVYKKMGFDFRSIFKGIVERIFLFISFYNGFPHALTFFSAIKNYFSHLRFFQGFTAGYSYLNETFSGPSLSMCTEC